MFLTIGAEVRLPSHQQVYFYFAPAILQPLLLAYWEQVDERPNNVEFASRIMQYLIDLATTD